MHTPLCQVLHTRRVTTEEVVLSGSPLVLLCSYQPMQPICTEYSVSYILTAESIINADISTRHGEPRLHALPLSLVSVSVMRTLSSAFIAQ